MGGKQKGAKKTQEMHIDPETHPFKHRKFKKQIWKP